ncbi:hypothetical protein GOL32_28990 [Sinorhizobium medicae]|nr:hypothetical protein [Sinorhizobium medicae]
MTDTAIPSSEILELIRGQARLETKIDTFLGAQNAMKSEIDAIKADVAEIKSQRRATAATVAAFSTAACVFWIFIGEKVKKIFVL